MGSYPILFQLFEWQVESTLSKAEDIRTDFFFGNIIQY